MFLSFSQLFLLKLPQLFEKVLPLKKLISFLKTSYQKMSFLELIKKFVHCLQLLSSYPHSSNQTFRPPRIRLTLRVFEFIKSAKLNFNLKRAALSCLVFLENINRCREITAKQKIRRKINFETKKNFFKKKIILSLECITETKRKRYYKKMKRKSKCHLF